MNVMKNWGCLNKIKVVSILLAQGGFSSCYFLIFSLPLIFIPQFIKKGMIKNELTTSLLIYKALHLNVRVNPLTIFLLYLSSHHKTLRRRK